MGSRQTAEHTATLEEGLSCPTSQDSPCKVESLVNEVLFVQAAPAAFLCYQRTSFGESYICRCPARKEIYKRHGR